MARVNHCQHLFLIDHDRPANLPSENPTHSFWTHSSPDANPLAREGSTGTLTTDADVCIIGSGITGISVAYHLFKADVALTVVVLEARDFCTGATGRNGGHLTPAAFARFDDYARKYGNDEARRSYALEAHTTESLVHLIQEHVWTDDVDLVQGGHVDLLFTRDELEEARRDREAAARAGWGLDEVVELSEAEVEATFGARYPAVRIPGYNVWPLKLVTKLYERAKTQTRVGFQLALHTHTPVKAVEQVTDGDGVRAYALSTPRGTITCSRVVHATNGYASHLLPFLTGSRGIVPVRGQVIATRASVSPSEIKTTSWAANDGYEYWFSRPIKTPDEKSLAILGGARDMAQPGFEMDVDDDTMCHPEVGKALREFLPAVFEGKFERGREPEMEWTGIMGYTALGDPFVGPVDKLPGATASHTGQYIVAGYSGHGMPRAFGCAEVIVQMILAELTGEMWTQPEWFPTRYLTWDDRGTALRN